MSNKCLITTLNAIIGGLPRIEDVSGLIPLSQLNTGVLAVNPNKTPYRNQAYTNAAYTETPLLVKANNGYVINVDTSKYPSGYQEDYIRMRSFLGDEDTYNSALLLQDWNKDIIIPPQSEDKKLFITFGLNTIINRIDGQPFTSVSEWYNNGLLKFSKVNVKTLAKGTIIIDSSATQNVVVPIDYPSAEAGVYFMICSFDKTKFTENHLTITFKNNNVGIVNASIPTTDVVVRQEINSATNGINIIYNPTYASEDTPLNYAVYKIE